MLPRLFCGVLVTVAVSTRVKADPGKHPASDEFPVMKLNLVKDYQTGIYDYNELTSSFVALQPVNGRAAGSPTTISFSRQEWRRNFISIAAPIIDPSSAMRRMALPRTP